MKRYIVWFTLLFYLFSVPSTLYAAVSATAAEPSVYDTIHNGGGVDKAPPTSPSSNEAVKQDSPSLFSLLFKFIGSFILVVLLLFGLMRFLSKRTRLLQSNGPILPMGGYMLGNNRSVQVVLVGQTIYILGVGESVTLLKEIPQGEEYQHLLEGYESQTDTISTLTNDVKKKWNVVFNKHLKNMDQENGEE
ncbi:MAG TPA: flagellar biosynthetic protein FliO [Bacillota bacterium]|nr:flagellar biosynthetic protein FliO [Bacillota bacterium]